MKPDDGLALIHQQVMWNRLIAVVEEQAQTLLRTAFSPIVREAGDLSAGVFDLRGRMLAQAVTGTPGHVNTMAESVPHFIRHFPLEEMRSGDVYITNDPWLGTGHLNDFLITTPCFHRSKLVALFACTSHLMDIGGLGSGTDATDVYMEGLYIPMLKLCSEGVVNETLMEIIRTNTRLPVDTVGDVYSLMNCNEIGCRRLLEMMETFSIDSLDALAEHICTNSENAVRREIAKLPHGTWRFEMTVDGFEAPIKLVASVAVSEEGVSVDYSGTSGPSKRGINVPMAYTKAYTSFGLGCLFAPHTPNNAGTLAPFSISAPPSCILNAPPPLPVAARHVIGQMLPDMVFGCLHQVISGRIPAEGTSCLWNLTIRGRRDANDTSPYGFVTLVTAQGGTGARPNADGLSATAYPSGIKGTPVEIVEAANPLIVWRKELRADSGGAGRKRGGLGQVVEVGSSNGLPIEISARFDRIKHAPRGRDGGLDGANGYLGLKSGSALNGKGSQTIPHNDRIVAMSPGGGGLGPARQRDQGAVLGDVEKELVSQKVAREIYGLKVEEKVRVNETTE